MVVLLARKALLFSHSVVSNFLRPHELQHTRLSCPSKAPRACSNSCPLSRWCHPTISPSVLPFSSCPQSFPASGSFLMSWVFASGAELQLQHQSFQWIALGNTTFEREAHRCCRCRRRRGGCSQEFLSPRDSLYHRQEVREGDMFPLVAGSAFRAARTREIILWILHPPKSTRRLASRKTEFGMKLP